LQAAALLPVIRDNLNLTKPQLNNAGIAAVTGTIASRILIGSFCDSFGPRWGGALIMLLTAAPVYGMALVSGYAGFVISRMCIGFSLASFVVCQFWCSVRLGWGVYFLRICKQNCDAVLPCLACYYNSLFLKETQYCRSAV
jgi:nitrate/nitrite transporter NarK